MWVNEAQCLCILQNQSKGKQIIMNIMLNIYSSVQHNPCFLVQRIHTFRIKTVHVWTSPDLVCTACVFGVAVYRT